MAELIDKNLSMEELHSIFEGDADLRKDYEYMGIDDCIRSMPTTTEAEIRSKAIEEFAEKLKESLKNKYRHFLDIDVDGFEWLTTEAVETHIDETVKELKGE